MALINIHTLAKKTELNWNKWADYCDVTGETASGGKTETGHLLTSNGRFVNCSFFSEQSGCQIVALSAAPVTLQRQLHLFTTRWKQTRMKRDCAPTEEHASTSWSRVWISNLRFSAPFKISHYAILWKKTDTQSITTLVNSEDSQVIASTVQDKSLVIYRQRR